MTLRNSLIVAFLLSCPFWSLAQPFGNEWINYNQAYYKIPVAENGIFRLTYNELLSAGFPVNSVNPQVIQLFHRGVEQSIFFQGQGDGRFDPGDYFEFYGQKNQGEEETGLYKEVSDQANPYYSLYSDSSFYFLTFNITGTQGKRMADFSENNVNNLPKQLYVLKDQLQLFTNNFSYGHLYSDATYITYTDNGEGFTGTAFSQGSVRQFPFKLTKFNSAGSNPVIEVLLNGRNGRTHNIELSVGPNAGALRVVNNTIFSHYDHQSMTSVIQSTDVSASGDLVVQVRSTSTTADRISVAYVTVRYAENLDWQGKNEESFTLQVVPGGKAYVEVPNAASISKIYDITNPASPLIIGYSLSGTTARFIVPNTQTSRELYLRDQGFKTTTAKRVKFRLFDPSQANYIIVSNKYLHQPAGSYADPVKAYGAYRASAAGGGFDTLTANMDQLFDQFNYGYQNPLAIKRFCTYLFNGGNPEYLVLLGKGLYYFDNYYRTGPQTVDDITYRDLVPAAGYPGNDIWYTQGMNGVYAYEPALKTGRISANTALDVSIYLDKVKQMADVPFDALWRKNLIHLSGGQTEQELISFRQVVDQLAVIAEGNYLGGNVTTQSKKTNGSVELINIAESVNSGVCLVTFFGHSGASLTDIDIGYVSDPLQGYDNPSKYPMIMVNGCNAGDIHHAYYTLGEDWLLTPQKGALNFLAHSATGLSSDLKIYSDLFYDIAMADSIYLGKSLGAVHQYLAKRYLETRGTSETQIAQAQQMMLQGDPAVYLFGAPEPDYAINDNSLFLDAFDKDLSAQADSFRIGIIVKNFGRTDNELLPITVNRTLDDGTMINYEVELYDPIKYQDTLFFTIRNNITNGGGNNRFIVTLDPLNNITELSDMNNQGTLIYNFPTNGTTNLLPYDFSMVSNTNMTLISQVSDPFEGIRELTFELDTTYLFNSAFKKQGTASGKGPIDFSTTLLSTDSTVYFWRTRLAQPMPGEDTSWVNSSFIYINNSTGGWSQSNWGQFIQDEVTGLDKNNVTKEWNFKQTENELYVKTYGDQNGLNSPENLVIDINGRAYIVDLLVCRANSVNLVAFDQSSTSPYVILDNGNFDVLDPQRCGRRPQVINTLIQTDVVNNLLIDDYVNQVKSGDYILLVSSGTVDYTLWPASTIAALESIGADNAILTTLTKGAPYILLGRKDAGTGNALAEVVAATAPADGQEIDLSATIAGAFDNGAISSTRIGPAQSWTTLYKKIEDIEPNDVVNLQVLGETYGGVQQVLINSVPNYSTDLSAISATQYPYLVLELNLEDKTNLTPPQLERWQVTYMPAPEGILYMRTANVGQVDLNEGLSYSADFSFINISTYSYSDSLSVRYSMFNQSSRTENINTFKILAPAPGDSTHFTVTFPTLDMAGLNDLNIFVNPFVLAEQNYNNNVISLPSYLKVAGDNQNPILEVTFDGKFILDGEIVSPSPSIVVRINDNNHILLKTDTTGVTLFLKQPGELSAFKQIAISSPEVNWTPATATESFMLDYHPENLEDGLYTLRVQAPDGSGNISGVEPYIVSFEVINESTITNFYPYPNPFSTSVQFVFTLTGADIPDELIIQIMTVTGRVVREITQDEIGPLRSGNNKTAYAWDGKDEYGDQLANGVYLYRVIMGSSVQGIEHRETAGDKAFVNGYGKMYLLR